MKVWIVVLSAVAAFGFASLAGAQQNQGEGQNPAPSNPPAASAPSNAPSEHAAHGPRKHPCAKDIESFCPGMHWGDHKLGPCLHEHKDELSPACKRAVRHMMHRRRAMKAEQESNGTSGNGGAGTPAPGGDNSGSK